MNLGSMDLEVSPKNRAAAGLRTQVNELTDHLARRDTGLMVTVDEIHGGSLDDLRALGAVIQHCFREERPVAFLAAGLPAAVTDLLNDDVVTFLRRADRHHLGGVDAADVADALRQPIQESGRRIHEPALFDLSSIDRTFLAAMAVDEVPSRMADVAARMNVGVNYASQYRLRLIGADMIRPAGHGRVDFAVPYLRDYLRDHAATGGL